MVQANARGKVRFEKGGIHGIAAHRAASQCAVRGTTDRRLNETEVIA
jgi:hypothetical protein